MALNKITGFVRRFKGTHAFQSLMLAGKLLAVNVAFAFAPAASGVSEVTVSVNDADGNAIPGAHALDLYLSDAADGEGLTATTASGAVTVKAGTGTELGALTAKKALRVVTNADGTLVLSISDTAKTGFYVAASIPGIAVASVSRVMATGDYGA